MFHLRSIAITGITIVTSGFVAFVLLIMYLAHVDDLNRKQETVAKAVTTTTQKVTTTVQPKVSQATLQAIRTEMADTAETYGVKIKDMKLEGIDLYVITSLWAKKSNAGVGLVSCEQIARILHDHGTSSDVTVWLRAGNEENLAYGTTGTNCEISSRWK